MNIRELLSAALAFFLPIPATPCCDDVLCSLQENLAALENVANANDAKSDVLTAEADALYAEAEAAEYEADRARRIASRFQALLD